MIFSCFKGIEKKIGQLQQELTEQLTEQVTKQVSNQVKELLETTLLDKVELILQANGLVSKEPETIEGILLEEKK